jgi:hypothetical protein
VKNVILVHSVVLLVLLLVANILRVKRKVLIAIKEVDSGLNRLVHLLIPPSQSSQTSR